MCRLTVIPCGRLLIDKGVNLTPGYDLGVQIRIPVTAYLIEIGKKRILIDSGLNPLVIEDPVRAIGDYIQSNTPLVSRADHILSRLSQIGMGPDDIDMVVCTHLHFDHAGGNQFFGSCDLIVQKSEIESARNSPDYIRHDWDYAHLNYHQIEGDEEIMTGVDLISTPGHSAGHQSVLVNLPKTGAVLIAGDAVAHSDHWCRDSPALAVDKDLLVNSRLRLKHIADTKQCLTLFSHDPEQWSALRVLPDYYD